MPLCHLNDPLIAAYMPNNVKKIMQPKLLNFQDHKHIMITSTSMKENLHKATNLRTASMTNMCNFRLTQKRRHTKEINKCEKEHNAGA